MHFSENLLIDVSAYGGIKNVDGSTKQIKTNNYNKKQVQLQLQWNHSILEPKKHSRLISVTKDYCIIISMQKVS